MLALSFLLAPRAPGPECLRTVVIDRIGDGKIEPHTGDGDRGPGVRRDRKRRTAEGDRLRERPRLRTPVDTAEGRALLSQVWQWHGDDDFQVIAILSSALVAQNMRLAVEGMARYGRKSVLYLGTAGSRETPRREHR